jgi:ribose 5-phosphate isomerase B
MAQESAQTKIHLATDHAGFEMKEIVKDKLESDGYEVVDHGAYESNPKDDYPDFVHPAATAVAKSDGRDRGIVFGFSGQGEAMVANRLKGVRAAVFYGPPKKDNSDEGIIELSRKHNDANILSIGAGFVTDKQAIDAVDEWLSTEFTEATRHERRIEKIDFSGSSN